MNRDSEIQASLVARLHQEMPGAAGVSVVVEDRIIVLGGSVEDTATRAAIEAMAEQHPLARGYASSIRVVPAPRSSGVAPGQQAAGRGIRIDLREKWAVLTGEVEWTHQRVRAERCMRRIEGFRSILNRLSVRPHAGNPIPVDHRASVIVQSPHPG